VAERFAELFTTARADHPLDAVLSVDVRSYLPDDLLVKVDVASMASSLEVRSPLLDHELVEWAARLPASFKLRGRTTKWLLKRAHRDVLPPEILSRPKQGFGVPLERWLREDLRELAHESLLGAGARTAELFRREQVARLLDEHGAARADHSYRLWALLVLEEWMRQAREPGAAPARRERGERRERASRGERGERASRGERRERASRGERRERTSRGERGDGAA
jgi:asparagine synthase (glutamine-hydrolysing)